MNSIHNKNIMPLNHNEVCVLKSEQPAILISLYIDNNNISGRKKQNAYFQKHFKECIEII